MLTMTMPIINPFRPVVHEKKIFKDVCYINLFKTMFVRVWPFVTPGTVFEETGISLS